MKAYNSKNSSNNSLKKYLKLILIIGLLLFYKEMQAQPEFDDEVTDTPIDTYSSILGIISMFLGLSKFEKGRKTWKNQKKTDKVLNFFVVIIRRIMFAGFFKRKEI